MLQKKKVMYDNKVYESRGELARALGVTNQKVSTAIRSGWKLQGHTVYDYEEENNVTD